MKIVKLDIGPFYKTEPQDTLITEEAQIITNCTQSTLESRCSWWPGAINIQQYISESFLPTAWSSPAIYMIRWKTLGPPPLRAVYTQFPLSPQFDTPDDCPQNFWLQCLYHMFRVIATLLAKYGCELKYLQSALKPHSHCTT